MKLVYGLIGEKLQHSLSPKIHSYIHKSLGIDGKYELFELPLHRLGSFIQELKHRNISGANVTVPFKIEVIKHLNDLSHEAKKLGSVNTICFGDSLMGYNTDYYGFGALLGRHDINVIGKSAVVLGTGGSARSTVHYLLDNGVKEIFVVSRNPESVSSELRLNSIKIISYKDISQLGSKELIINCTPSGMYPSIDSTPIDEDVLSDFKTAVDLIYNPTETVFLKAAKKHGLKTANGLYMLVAQAAASYRFWNNIEISHDTTEDIYTKLYKF